MLTIRLQRVGRRNDPNFRIVLTDSKRAPKSGGFLEILGSYNPKLKAMRLKPERITYWRSHGAQVSRTVHNLLLKNKAISGS